MKTMEHESRYQRYNREHPTVSIRLSKENYQLLKAMANGEALGTYCANALLNLHCNNCKMMLKKRGAQIRKFLDAQNVIKSLFKENETLKSSVTDWQEYAKSLQEKTEALKADLKQMVPKAKVQKKLKEAEKSGKNWEVAYDGEARENAELREKIDFQEETIQGYNEELIHLKRELELCRTRFKNAVFLDGKDAEHNLKLLEEYAPKVDLTRDELADAFIAYGLDHKKRIFG